MAEALMLRTPTGYVPSDEHEAERLRRHKVGKLYRMEFTEVRNPKFHRKFMAMLNVGFDAFEPTVKQFRGQPVAKNFDRFRKDCVIMAGFFDANYDINGDAKLTAKSISFANMSEEEFERVYNEVANVLLRKVLKNYTRDDLDQVVDQILNFV